MTPGPSSSVLLHVGAKVLRLAPEFNVDCRNGLVGEIQTASGTGRRPLVNLDDQGRDQHSVVVPGTAAGLPVG